MSFPSPPASCCVTNLKRCCREVGIPRWPARKIKSFDKMISRLEASAALTTQPRTAEGTVAAAGEQGPSADLQLTLQRLEEERKGIVREPTLAIKGRTKRLRQALFKAEHARQNALACGGLPRDDGTERRRGGGACSGGGEPEGGADNDTDTGSGSGLECSPSGGSVASGSGGGGESPAPFQPPSQPTSSLPQLALSPADSAMSLCDEGADGDDGDGFGLWMAMPPLDFL